MTRLFKTTAIAALALTTAMPAFAAGHSSMTCGEYNGLSAADQDAVAMAAVAELSGATGGTIAPNDGTATATDPSAGQAAEESPTGSTNTLADNNGTATATSTVPAGDDMTRFAEEIGVLKRTCLRSIDATVMEAAAGQDGTR